MADKSENPATPAPDVSTGLPLLRTWRAVYVAVTIIFVLWVVLLTILPRVFA